MTSTYIKDSYHTVSTAAENQKFLPFTWKENPYKFTALPDGFGSCPRTFTKLLKPSIARLRQQGVDIVQYLDDNYIQADTFQEATQNTNTAVTLFQIGFIIHPEKSVLNQTQEITFRGFQLNSVTMFVGLATEKETAIQEAVLKLVGLFNRPSGW